MSNQNVAITILQVSLNEFPPQSPEYKQVAYAISLLQAMESGGGFESLVHKVRNWGLERKIIGPDKKGTVQGQIDKLVEEFEELDEGVLANDQHLIVDSIGDMTVVLILLAELINVPFEMCLLAAYDEIKNRKGQMIDGVFCKEPEDQKQGKFVATFTPDGTQGEFGVVVDLEGNERPAGRPLDPTPPEDPEHGKFRGHFFPDGKEPLAPLDGSVWKDAPPENKKPLKENPNPEYFTEE